MEVNPMQALSGPVYDPVAMPRGTSSLLVRYVRSQTLPDNEIPRESDPPPDHLLEELQLSQMQISSIARALGLLGEMTHSLFGLQSAAAALFIDPEEALQRALDESFAESQQNTVDGEGTPAETINNLKAVQLKQRDISAGHEDVPQSQTDASSCAVCRKYYRAGDVVLQLPCDHWYCPGCILNWLKNHDTCPLCRAVVTNVPPLSPAAIKAKECLLSQTSPARGKRSPVLCNEPDKFEANVTLSLASAPASAPVDPPADVAVAPDAPDAIAPAAEDLDDLCVCCAAPLSGPPAWGNHLNGERNPCMSGFVAVELSLCECWGHASCFASMVLPSAEPGQAADSQRAPATEGADTTPPNPPPTSSPRLITLTCPIHAVPSDIPAALLKIPTLPEPFSTYEDADGESRSSADSSEESLAGNGYGREDLFDPLYFHPDHDVEESRDTHGFTLPHSFIGDDLLLHAFRLVQDNAVNQTTPRENSDRVERDSVGQAPLPDPEPRPCRPHSVLVHSAATEPPVAESSYVDPPVPEHASSSTTTESIPSMPAPPSPPVASSPVAFDGAMREMPLAERRHLPVSQLSASVLRVPVVASLVPSVPLQAVSSSLYCVDNAPAGDHHRSPMHSGDPASTRPPHHLPPHVPLSGRLGGRQLGMSVASPDRSQEVTSATRQLPLQANRPSPSSLEQSSAEVLSGSPSVALRAARRGVRVRQSPDPSTQA